jgi:hypothetical protein
MVVQEGMRGGDVRRHDPVVVERRHPPAQARMNAEVASGASRSTPWAAAISSIATMLPAFPAMSRRRRAACVAIDT